MSATLQRNQVAKLAPASPDKALEKARGIKEPWFRAQALAHVARYWPQRAVTIAREAAQAAQQCDDAYKRVAVRAWEIAALVEVGATPQAVRSLHAAIAASVCVEPVASRAEALILLLQAAARLNARQRDAVYKTLQQACDGDSHWRCKRALRDANLIRSGEFAPREFFSSQ